MEIKEATKILNKWSEITNEARDNCCNGVGMFIEDMNQVKMAYNILSPYNAGSLHDAKIRQFNGVDIFLQEVVDRERTGRI